MNDHVRRDSRIRLVTVLIGALAAASCTGELLGVVRTVTVPPEIAYVPRAEVRVGMRALAANSNDLSGLLRVAADGREIDRAAVVDRLRAMERAARGLGAGWPTNHPMVTGRIDAFVEDVVRARTAVEHEPPRYVLAGMVAGACLYCHGER